MDDWARFIWNAILSILIAIGAFVWNRAVKRMDDMEKYHYADAKDLADFKLESSKTYVKEETIQQSLSRIHGRIDDVFEALLQKNLNK